MGNNSPALVRSVKGYMIHARAPDRHGFAFTLCGREMTHGWAAASGVGVNEHQFCSRCKHTAARKLEVSNG